VALEFLCGVAEGLRSAAATGKPLAVSWAVVVSVGAFGGVVAWKVASFVDYGEQGQALRALGGVGVPVSRGGVLCGLCGGLVGGC